MTPRRPIADIDEWLAEQTREANVWIWASMAHQAYMSWMRARELRPESFNVFCRYLAGKVPRRSFRGRVWYGLAPPTDQTVAWLFEGNNTLRLH